MFFFLLACLVVSCKKKDAQHQVASGGKPIITVSIEPLRYFTEAIAGNEFKVVSLVPKGSSPETYDPKPQQLVSLADSKAYFRIGYIGFEQVWMDKLMDNAPHVQVFDLSNGVRLIADSTHVHADEESDADSDALHHHHLESHRHASVDPHIWNSTQNARIIATNILRALCTIDKLHEEEFIQRYQKLCTTIEQTDRLILSMLSSTRADHSFMIYHPALSYFARDYGLRQIPIEESGKEPSPVYLTKLMDICRKEKPRVIFIQPEFDRRNAEIIASQTGTEIVLINPLSYHWEQEMLNVAKHLE